MSYYTDGSTLPRSTLHSGSDSSSPAPSSLDVEIKNLDFLNHSWPFLDRFGDARFSDTALTADDVDLDSWNFKEFPGTKLYQPQELGGGAASGRISKQNPSCSTHQTNGSPPSSLNSSGCSSDASVLYNSHGKHYNPSGAGHRASQELEEFTHWINSHLQYSLHSEYITDLTKSLADGQTLLYVVEILLGITIRPVHVKPALDVQKTENIDMCLDVLKRYGVPVDDVDTEDIVKENTKAVLVLCQSLHKHFGCTSGSRRRVSPQDTRCTTSPRNISPVVTPPTDRDRGWHTSTPILPRPSKKSPIDRDDVALLEWVANLTGRNLDGYESFQDGHVLCLLINQLTDGAVPDVVLEYGIPSEKISLALTFSKDELGVGAELNPQDILNLTDISKLSLYLKTLHKIFIEQKIQERKCTYTKMGEPEGPMKHVKKLKEVKRFAEEESLGDGLVDRNATERLLTSKIIKKEYSVVDKKDAHFSSNNSLFDYSSPIIIKDSKDSNHSSAISRGRNKCSDLSKCRADSDNKSPNSHKITTSFSKNGGHADILEEIKNLENENGSPSTSLPSYPLSKNSEESPAKKTNHKQLHPKSHLGHSAVLDLIHRQSVFDPENWTSPCKSLVFKSWRKEREKAKAKLDFLTEQLKLLREEYFKYIGVNPSEGCETEIPIREGIEHLLDNNTSNLPSGEITETPTETTKKYPSRELNRKVTKPEYTSTRSNYTSKMLSESFNSYLEKGKGTTPPYRTWSKYENTEGDRYKLWSKKKKEMVSSKDVTQDHVRFSVSDVTRGVTAGKRDDKENWPSKSPQMKKIQETRSSDFTEKRLSDDGLSVSSTDIQEDSDRRLHGITAFVRLSSKKANAESDSKS